MDKRIRAIRNAARHMMRLSKHREAVSKTRSFNVVGSHYGWYIVGMYNHQIRLELSRYNVNPDVFILTPWCALPESLIDDIEDAGWLPYGERVSPLELLAKSADRNA